VAVFDVFDIVRGEDTSGYDRVDAFVKGDEIIAAFPGRTAVGVRVITAR
jgi:hypothetical protein